MKNSAGLIPAVVVAALSGAMLCSRDASACSPLLQRYPVECAMADRYKAVKDDLAANHKVNADYIAGYRSLRLIEWREYDKKRKDVKHMPWKIYPPAPKTWLLWERGAAMAETMADNPAKTTIDKKDVEDLNRALISKDMMSGLARLKGNAPGKMRSSWFQAPPGTKFDCDGHRMSDKTYNNMRKYEIKDSEGEPLVRMKFFTRCGKGGWDGQLWFVASNKVPKEMERWLAFVNSYMKKYLNNEPADMSPIEFAAYAQRWFIGIHPFGDGNGRTSRFVQDFIMRKLGLPAMPTGRLELSLPKDEYLSKSKEELERSLKFLEYCRQEYGKRAANKAHRIKDQCVSIYEDADTGEDEATRRERVAFFEELRRDRARAGIEIAEVAEAAAAVVKSLTPPKQEDCDQAKEVAPDFGGAVEGVVPEGVPAEVASP